MYLLLWGIQVIGHYLYFSSDGMILQSMNLQEGYSLVSLTPKKGYNIMNMAVKASCTLHMENEL